MAKPSLGRKTLSVFMAFTMAISLNVPAAAWANDATGNADAATEQPQENLASGGGSQDLASDESNSQVAGVATQAGESETPAASSEEAEAVASVDGNKYYSLQAAIDAAQDGETVALLSDVAENVTINKAITLDGQNYVIANMSECGKVNDFNKPNAHSINVTVPGVTVQNFTFGDKADIVSDAFEGAIVVKDCTFNATTDGNVRTPVAINATEVTVTGNTFAGEDNAYYNPIELTQDKNVPLKSATVSGNHFTKKFHNNGISVYSYEDGTVVNVENNDFVFAGNGLRVSDYNDVAATFNVDGNSYAGTLDGDYAGFLLLQNVKNSKGDFSKLTFNISNMDNKSGNKQLFYVYDDVDKIVSNQNPTIVGDESIKDMTTTNGKQVVCTKIDGAYYDSLPAAVSAAKDGETVVLVSDANVASRVDINGARSITLDIDGKTVASSLGTAFRVADGFLDVKDSAGGGKIFVSGEAFRVVGNNNSVTWENAKKSELTIENGVTVESSGDCCIFYYGNGAKAIVAGSLKSTGVYGTIMGQGTIDEKQNNGGTELVIQDGARVEHPAGLAIYQPQVGNLIVDGGVVCGEVGAIEIRRGSLVVNGGELTSTANVFECAANGSGGTTTGAAVAVAPHGAVGEFGKTLSVVVNGGEFSGIYGLYQADPNGHTAKGVTVDMTVRGGSFASTGTVEVDGVTYGSALFSEQCIGFLSGGRFSDKVSADYCANDYEIIPTSDGMFTVAMKGESKPAEGNISGSVSVAGSDVSVDGQKQIADSAAAAAGSLKSDEIAVDESTKTAKIGDVTVDASAAADAIEAVSNAAKTEDASSVDVKLVVKADTNVEASDKIKTQAKATNAEVIPFSLSVDMVTEVKNADGDVLASAVAPVKETADAIKVTIMVDPATLVDNGVKKNVVVARNHEGSVDIITPLSVDYETGAVTFETGKFSDYAVLASNPNQGYELGDYTNADGSRKAIVNSEFNQSDDMAFAGWYTNPELTIPCASDATTGTVYPKFVPVSELITFKGGSLRMDQEASVGTSLRFGYETRIPNGSTLVKVAWKYKLKGSLNEYEGNMVNYLINKDSLTANIVLKNISPDYYNRVYCTQESVTYKTVDGTQVIATESAFNERSVGGVADEILASGYAQQVDKEYAQQIKDTISAQ